MFILIDLENFEIKKEKVFEGNIYTTPIKNWKETFFKVKDSLTDTGLKSMFKALKIPKPNFFLEKTPSYIKDTFEYQKNHFENKNLMVLVRDNKIEFCSLENDIEQEDPSFKFDFHKDFTEIGEDLEKGFKRYAYIEHLEPKEFGYSFFMDVPLMYHNSVKMETGLYRVICTNGMVTNIDTKSVKLNHSIISDHNVYEPIITNIKNNFIDNTDRMNSFINYLKEYELKPTESNSLLSILKEDRIINKEIFISSLNHIITISENNIIDDITMPKELNTLLDFTNLVTRFSQVNSLSKRNVVEKKVFDFLYGMYQRHTKDTLEAIDLKELIVVGK